MMNPYMLCRQHLGTPTSGKLYRKLEAQLVPRWYLLKLSFLTKTE